MMTTDNFFSKRIYRIGDARFDGMYSVTDSGSIISHRFGKERVLKPFPDGKRGYLKVKLYDVDGKPHTKSIHRIVALHFIDNPDNKPQVNHIDGNVLNNNSFNLEWSYNIDNIRHSIDNKNSEFRSRCLSLSQVHEICNRKWKLGQTLMSISITMDVSIHAIKKISQGVNYSYISKLYKEK